MKILLAACNAKYIHSNLAVYNLKSCSGEYSSRVVVKEYTINQIRDEILKDIVDRDERDMNRAVSPLKKAEDAVLVDSSEMGIDEVVESILSVYRKRVNG